MTKNYAFITNTGDYTNLEIVNIDFSNAMDKFKKMVEGAVNTTNTVGMVELEENGTGNIYIGQEISGPGLVFSFEAEYAPEFDEDDMTFDEYYESWLKLL